MLRAFGLDWRISLAQECLFYIRTCRNWRQVLAGRLHKIPFHQFDLRVGMVIAFPDVPPWQVFQEIWRREIYVRRYPSAWDAPQTVVDIGANIGVFSLLAVWRWHPTDILAYEPAPDNFQWLERNVHLSGAQQITCRSLAVAGTRGQAEFYLKGESGWHSLHGDRATSSITVQTVALDDVLAETSSKRIDFLKLDCEGAEYDALATHGAFLSEYVGFVAMEYHEVDGHTVKELTSVFESAGFRVELVPEPRWRTGMLYASNRSMS